MKYRIVVNKFDSGLNELLDHQVRQYNPRTRRTVVHNSEKTKNDKVCERALIKHGMNRVRIDNPIFMEYRFYLKDKRHDRSNVHAGFIKSFEDALQHLKIIKNDGFDDVLDPRISTFVDSKNPRVEVTIHEVIKRGK